MTARVALVSLGREAAKGEVRRVASWRLLFERAGAQVDEIALAPGRLPHLGGLPAVLRGDATPERLAWSGKRLLAALRAMEPAVVVVVSARAFDPTIAGGASTVILDLVDSLSRSYSDRAELVTGLARRLGYRSLAAAHHRVERRVSGQQSVRPVAAGWADAHDLGVEWVPILANPELAAVHDPVPDHAVPDHAAPDHDVLFFGTLRYPPNVDALERLGHIWPAVLRARPGTTALIAGSAPTDRVRALCRTQGWTLVADFPSLAELGARARVAVAPLARTAGIQIKVLDAAGIGLPQVVRSPALAGFDPTLPLTPFDDDQGFAAEIVRLLDDPAAAAADAQRVHDYVLDAYGVDRWAEWARAVLSS